MKLTYTFGSDGLDMIERSLRRLEDIEPLIESIDVHIALGHIRHDLEWFLGNEIDEVEE